MNKKLLILIPFILLAGCQKGGKPADDSTLISIQVIDRNGFAETISSKDRLSRYQNTEFCDPQPYQKVLRVFGKNLDGKSVSKITSYHSNGHIWQYLEVVDGRAHGFYKEWHANGRQKLEFCVIEGVADLSELALSSWVFEGLNKVWDDQGNLIAEILYEKGMLHGDSLYYYQGGQLQKKLPYFQNDLQGEVLTFKEDGLLLEKICYEQGKIHGEAIGHKKDGSLLYREVFEKGELLDGIYYGTDNEVLSSVCKGTGKRAQFSEDKLTHLIEYKKGQPEGLVECFTKEGILHITYEQKEGKKHGQEKEYYLENPSQVKIILNWQEDVLQGTVKTFFLEGGQESQKEMYQNKKNGPLYAWYKNGDLLLREEYENDLLISGSYYKKNDKKPVSKVTNSRGYATLHNSDGYFLKKIPYEKGRPLLESESER